MGRTERKGEKERERAANGERTRVRRMRAAGKRSEVEGTIERRRTGGFHIARMRVQSHVWRLCA